MPRRNCLRLRFFKREWRSITSDGSGPVKSGSKNSSTSIRAIRGPARATFGGERRSTRTAAFPRPSAPIPTPSASSPKIRGRRRRRTDMRGPSLRRRGLPRPPTPSSASRSHIRMTLLPLTRNFGKPTAILPPENMTRRRGSIRRWRRRKRAAARLSTPHSSSPCRTFSAGSPTGASDSFGTFWSAIPPRCTQRSCSSISAGLIFQENNIRTH